MLIAAFFGWLEVVFITEGSYKIKPWGYIFKNRCLKCGHKIRISQKRAVQQALGPVHTLPTLLEQYMFWLPKVWCHLKLPFEVELHTVLLHVTLIRYPVALSLLSCLCCSCCMDDSHVWVPGWGWSSFVLLHFPLLMGTCQHLAPLCLWDMWG